MKLLTTLFVASAVVMMASTASANIISNPIIFNDFNSPSNAPPYIWQFDNLTVTPTSPSYDGSQYYNLTATVTNGWYAGGFGFLVQQGVYDVFPWFSIWVKGDNSWGTLKYEVYENDGDIFAAGDYGSSTYTPINWTGWQQVIIPFSDFTLRTAGTSYPDFNGTWQGAIKSCQIIASVGGDGSGSIDIGVENIEALQVIPEPTSMLLLGSGLIGMFAFGRRKRREK